MIIGLAAGFIVMGLSQAIILSTLGVFYVANSNSILICLKMLSGRSEYKICTNIQLALPTKRCLFR